MRMNILNSDSLSYPLFIYNGFISFHSFPLPFVAIVTTIQPPSSNHQRQRSLSIKLDRHNHWNMMSPTKNRRNLFIKCAATVTVLIIILWALIPNETIPIITYSVQEEVKTESTTKAAISTGADNVVETVSEHCANPYQGKPLIQHAVMIDAGSSGSRVHVYRFNHCKKEPELENEVFHMLSPGLSSYADDPKASANSLKELMEIAVNNVPAELQHCTPIAVKATAGLRLLGTEKSTAILESVRSLLSEYKFTFQASDVDVMDGKDEGVYAWITVNYLLGKLKSSQKGQSAAIFDLGGASTQIVFEPTFADEKTVISEGEHKYTLDYGNEIYSLYQHSYLGFGLNEARKTLKRSAIDLWKEDALKTGKVFHPCLPVNHTETFNYTTSNNTEVPVQLVGTGADYTACRGFVEKIFQKEKECALKPCSFNGMYQPPLTETFKNRYLYVFSYFYDLSQPLGMPTEFSVGEYGEVARRVCAGETETFKHVPQALDLLSSTPDYCLDLTYTHGLLGVGYDLPSSQVVRTAKKIAGAETGWCLGASIALIDGISLCTVHS
ncbi:nucleoside phosphatase family-domain-containing protein [Spinellus fusiger]|nr:nucleoside phosphatase family-domain-containing protein [Spinellus fusiger]